MNASSLLSEVLYAPRRAHSELVEVLRNCFAESLCNREGLSLKCNLGAGLVVTETRSRTVRYIARRLAWPL